MRRLSALLAAASAALALATGPCAAETWQAVTPEGAGYSVELPGKPSAEEETVDLGDGKSARVRTIKFQSLNTIYDVTIADYPKGTVQSIGEQQLLDNARNGAVANAPGPLLSETKLDVGGHPARELMVDMTMNLVARSRIFTVGDRLFNVGAITNKDKTKAEAIEKYFASFKLLDSAGK